MPSNRTFSSARVRRLLVDPRLVLGLVLVASSVAGVVALVSAVDDTATVYLAPGPLAPGEHITVDDLRVEQAALPPTGARYLQPGDVPSAGFVVLRPVGEGEMIPRVVAGSAAGIRMSAVVVETGGLLPDAVQAGATVDLWAARVGEGGEVEAPGVIAAGAVVVRVVESDSIMGGAGGSGVEILVAKDRVARVIEALARGDALTVIPAGTALSN